jgi:polysaccharide export outer membrane protein
MRQLLKFSGCEQFRQFALAGLLMGLAVSIGSAQTNPVARAATGDLRAPAAGSAASDDLYRIGPGDLISLTTTDYPQLSSDGIRVDNRGMILVPMVNDEIQAACHTESELSQEITKRYLKYLKEPQVRVFIKEYQSQPVAVLGAVHSPGRFQLQRRLRLLELLTFVAGPTELAGQSIQVIHAGTGPVCSGSDGAAAGIAADLITLNLTSTLKGEKENNPFVRPGDIITVPEADQYYVVGNVAKPAPYPIKEKVGIVEAIAMAGGLLPDSKTDRVRIVRQKPGSAPAELFVDLKTARSSAAEQFLLQPNDIVEVEKKGGIGMGFKTAFRTMIPSLATTIPYRVIP